jgi:hypothetical protein
VALPTPPFSVSGPRVTIEQGKGLALQRNGLSSARLYPLMPIVCRVHFHFRMGQFSQRSDHVPVRTLKIRTKEKCQRTSRKGTYQPNLTFFFRSTLPLRQSPASGESPIRVSEGWPSLSLMISKYIGEEAQRSSFCMTFENTSLAWRFLFFQEY